MCNVGRSLSGDWPNINLIFNSFVWKILWINNSKYNFQQRISWLSHRWRTQRNAIRNVNCRIQWIIESLNAYCALWYSEEHACLSISKHLKAFDFFFFLKALDLSNPNTNLFQIGRRVAWNAGAAGHSPELKAYLFSPVKRIIFFAAANIKGVWPY